MKLCDFCSVVKIMMDFISESNNVNQLDFMYELFKDFIESDAGYDFDFDNGLVCRWLKGTVKVSPKITAYYAEKGNIEALAVDIEENILPLLYDKDMAVMEVYHLLISDSTVSEAKKQNLIDETYPYTTDVEQADFLSRVLLFGMERAFVKRDTQTNLLIASGALSPVVRDYIYDGLVPKPCKHFYGREQELERLHSMLEDSGKIFIQGVAGIGKSEFAKMYAARHKSDYTNILYFNYGGSLKQMISGCDFADDGIDENEDIRFKRHNRFLRSLKEDTLLIIDNFNVIASDDALFDVMMKYRCKVLFTTRSSFSDYTNFELKEIEDTETKLRIVGYFYRDISENEETVKNIIDEVHSHTLSVELAARLLASGIAEPDKLLNELQSTKSVLRTEDKINLVKDGTSSKATYYEHIHKLVSLFGLSTPATDIMRSMTLIPREGILPRLFAKWLGLKTLNEVNELIEYGFIQTNEYRKISLHPLIQEISVDDTAPGIANCKKLIDSLHGLCLLHGLDLPYHELMFEIIGNIISLAEKDDREKYLLFIKDAFPYMEKYAYRSGMERIINELKQFDSGTAEKAMLLDYKAAFEHICNKNLNKALQYESQAVKYCDELLNTNPHLTANIFDNIGGLYHSVGQTDKARYYMEQAYGILSEHNLQYANDSVIMVSNYANLLADIGEPGRAIQALEVCAKIVREYNSDESSDYANLLWNTGCIYLQIGNREKAAARLKKALKIYAELWSNEPELMNARIEELKNLSAVYGLNTQNLLSGI